MQLPDGTTLMHAAGVPYDPVKAHEYYIRTRKLKGKIARAVMPTEKSKQAKDEYKQAATNFLSKLPMAAEGASVKDTLAFVNRLRRMTDDEMVAEAAKIRSEKGDNDGAQVATINALLKNRARVREANAGAKAKAKPKSTKRSG